VNLKKKKIILITGAEGFIATNLVKSLSNIFYLNVFGIGTKKFSKKISKNFGYKILINKNINEKNIARYFKNVDLIVHCAGTGTPNMSAKKNFDKNYLTTKNILNFCINTKKKPKVIFLSSYSVYGGLHKKKINENETTNPLTSYAKSKKKSEDILLKYSKKYNFPVVILRLSSVYGNGLTKQLMFDACKKISHHNNIFLGTGSEVRDWIHIDDVCSLIKKFIKKDFKKTIILNCGVGYGSKVRDVIQLIKKNLNSKNVIKFSKKYDQFPKILITDNSAAKKHKWSPKVTLKEGVKKYVTWFKFYYG